MSRSYKPSDIKQACDGADVAIVCLGTGMKKLTVMELNRNFK